MRKYRKKILFVILVLVVSGIIGVAAWMIAPYCVSDPMPELRYQTPVRTYLDRHGKILWLERTYDTEWRFPLELTEISPDAVRVILTAEDAGFYRHSGVDYSAICRAMWQNLTSFKVISGASTISMQLAGMTLPPGRKSIWDKLKQATLARKMEMCHSKDEILTEYLNRIPFGGKLYGIEAASQYYFGLTAAKINLAEATLLCGLPQKPNRFRPDRYLEAARERQRIVLKLLVRRGNMTQVEADRIRREEPLRLRDFRYPASFEQYAEPGESIFALRLVPPGAAASLDLELQSNVLQLLRTRRSHLPGVNDAAALLLDNRTGEVLVYIGSLDTGEREAGQVDAVRAIRSAGSALKPFLYAEAIDAGWIVAATRLSDAPLRYADYNPGNYDGQFYGTVTASYALSHSLNTPAIRLAAKLRPERLIQCFERLNLRSNLSREKNPGLSMALGTIGHSLFDMTMAYSVLAGGGALPTASFVRDGERRVFREDIFLPGSCQMVSLMLRERPLPGCAYEVAWKTGTSNNNCDAWCFAYTPEYTLGVWFGNKNGKPSPALVGVEAAAPAAGEIFDLLYRNRTAPKWPDLSTFELRELCADSGLTPGAFCRHKERQYAISGLPLAGCQSCTRTAAAPLLILSPVPQQYRVPAGHGETLTLNLRTNRSNIYWFLNGKYIGNDLSEYPFPVNANYTLRAVSVPDSDLPASTSEVKLSILPAK